MFAFENTSLRKLVAVAVISAIAAQPLQLAYAANHPFSSIKDINIINLTANVDWDYDGPAPLQLGTNGVTLTKDVIEKQILRETARSIYLMTEGKHRVGNVYVFKNSKYGENVDIKLINKTDRSNAHIAGWHNAGRSANYLSIDTVYANKEAYVYSYPLGDYGRVIAHEMGHYIYAVLDEYIDTTETTTTRPAFPNYLDNARSTIMANHEKFTRFSVAADYPNNGDNKTAQARIYGNEKSGYSGGSQWEMLVLDPKFDTSAAKRDHRGSRKLFEAFKGFTPPKTLAALDKFIGVYCPEPVFPYQQIAECLDSSSTMQGTPAEWRITNMDVYLGKLWAKSGGSALADAVDGKSGSAFENFKVVWVDSPSSAAIQRDALLIDRTMPQAAFKEAIAASVGEVQSRTDNSQLAIAVSPSDSALPVFPLKPVVANKQEMIKALLSLVRVDGKFDITKAYDQIAGLVNKGRGVADSSSIFVMTDAKREALISATLGGNARANKNAINIVKFDGPLLNSEYKPVSEYARKLNDLVDATGGDNYTADSSQKAAKAIRNMSQIDSGMRIGVLVSRSYQSSFGAHREITQFKVSKYDENISVEWFFDPSDHFQLGFSLVSPSGAVYNTIDSDSNPAEGYVLIKVPNTDNTKSGDWRVETSYSGSTNEGLEVEVSAESAVALNPSMSGGLRAEDGAPILRAMFGGVSPIIHAKVLANIYRTHDLALVLSKLELKDDGLGVDARPNDGSYAIDLSGFLPAGDYVVEFTAETNADSVFSTNLPFAMGKPVPDVAVGAGVVRVDSIDLSLEEYAPGVVVGRSGGCAVSNGPADAGLIGLLLAALIGLGLRRRNNSRSD
jgi:MYXO-CTERM domain-containing protein